MKFSQNTFVIFDAELAESQKACTKMDRFVASPQPFSTLESAVTKAECLFTHFIIEHNLPIAAADHAGKLFREMFVNVDGHPPADVIKGFACGRTKTTCIVKELAHQERTKLIKSMQTGPFSIATDGSNDRGKEKLYPIIVIYPDHETGTLHQALLGLLDLASERSTGSNIARL